MYRIAVTSRHLCQGDFLARVEALAEGKEYQAVMLREKDLSEKEYEVLAGQVLSIMERYHKKCILHSFYSVAEKWENPYLHLPLPLWESMAGETRQKLRTRFQEIGTSVHSLEQLYRAEELGADYVTAGHIYATSCKEGLAPRGLSFLHQICQQAEIPVFGIGGISRDREEEVIRQGAAGVCIMSGCMQDPKEMI